MSKDNTDRYGRRHRRDSEYGMGESMPGDVGDSKGTFFDRARVDDNVIVDGEVQSYNEHQRNQNSGESENHSKSNTSEFEGRSGDVVKVTVDRVSGSGNPIASHNGTDVHVPSGKPGETYEVELKAKSGYYVGKVRTKV